MVKFVQYCLQLCQVPAPVCITSLCGPTPSILYSYSKATWLSFYDEVACLKLHDEVRKLMTSHAAVPIVLKEILTDCVHTSVFYCITGPC